MFCMEFLAILELYGLRLATHGWPTEFIAKFDCRMRIFWLKDNYPARSFSFGSGLIYGKLTVGLISKPGHTTVTKLLLMLCSNCSQATRNLLCKNC